MIGRLLALSALLLLAGSAPSPKFYPDDPILVDHDDLPIERPGEIELSPTFDLLWNTFGRSEASGATRAMNVNTLGEVPDSSWFQNRIGIREMTLEELASGPNRSGPPRFPLTVVSAKASGITAGFTVRDREDRLFFIKFDPGDHPNLSTGADVIGKSFFHAIGYNVPEAYLVYLRSDDLTIDPGALLAVPGEKSVPMDREFLERMLDGAAHHPDGSVRAIASLAVPGEVIGPFTFQGTRPDDPNDVVPHEHRRELRGYRVFCAWLNHDDSRAINTLDTFIPDGSGRGHVRHYLIDFGSTLGSGSDYLRRIAPQDPRSSHEYILDFEPIWRAAYSFGLLDRPWRKIPYLYPRYAEIGRIEADFFEPHRWKPEYPNAAFDRMLLDDAFWAARIVDRFSDQAVRAIVATGDYLSQEAEDYLAETLIARRDKVVGYYYRQLNPLADFSVGETLRFRNLGVERGLGEVVRYEFEWFSFDNESGESTPLGVQSRVSETSIPIPGSDSEYLMVRIRSLCETEPAWAKAVTVYLRGSRVVGIEREI